MKLDQLAYAVIGSARIPEWRDFAVKVLGTMTEDGPDGALYLKYDEWHYRVLVLPAPDERFVAAGWSVRSRAAYLAALDDAKAAGLTVEEGGAEECDVRMVKEFFRFRDPNGTDHEVCWGRTMSAIPFVSPAGVSRFVTGDLGMGHVVLPSRGDFEECLGFYENVMGLEYSDFFGRRVGPDGKQLRGYFFHCDNARQHSLALIEAPDPTGLIHFLVEVGTLDDVGRAMDRARDEGAPLVRSLGRHVNDSVVSFYLESPSGFHIEYGFGGEVMDWTDHEVRNVSYGTHWGHEWQPGYASEVPTSKPGT
ncbi:VOC family protein [Streptomyces sp. NBC_00988]|uniref:VOC family protein n=1 Tax=Streptomyces sp. NBC_00988 TaxID=2903704 RepID=UPI003865D68F|nr:VOC family protein [Streptomyces sp. NBC_00988]